MQDLGVLSFNCRGIRSKNKRLSLFNHLKDLNYNIFCLQDTHFTPEMYKTIYSEWGSDIYISCKSSNSRGVAILLKNNDFKVNQEFIDEEGNYIILDLKTGDYSLTLVSLYGPNSDSPVFYKKNL